MVAGTKFMLACTSCNAEYGRESPAFRCEKCGEILEVVYDYSTLKLPRDFAKRKITQAKYQPFFPSKLSTMNEGGTRLLKVKSIRELAGGANAYLKIESENPTGSFKDRGSSVEIGRALELGYGSVCCASTGNMGLSVATYAKMEKLKCTIFISRSANKDKITKIARTGAEIVEVRGDFNKAISEAEEFARRNKVFMCGDYHCRKEGQKGVMFEIVEQFRYMVPDYVFVPVGNATLLAAVYKALKEFMMLKLIDRYPRIVAVQSSGCDPLVKAFESDDAIDYVRPRTYADAIAVGYPVFGAEGLGGVRDTDGSAISVTDKEIEAARSLLMKKEDIGSEPGGATAFAGFLSAAKLGKLSGKTAVAIVSGNNV